MANPPSGQQFAPRVYAPRVYAPRVYAPRVYAPRVYAPRVYAPRVYAPGSYIPANVSDASLSDAFSAAQNQTLLAVSTNTGNVDEIVSASTGNTDGVFYLRVQGHDDAAFDDNTPFQLTRTTKAANAGCAGLTTFPKDPDDAAPAVHHAADRHRHRHQPAGSRRRTTRPATDYLASLNQLAAATGGVVVERGCVRPGPGPLGPGAGPPRLPAGRQHGGRRHQGHRRRLAQRRAASTSSSPAATT